MRTLTYQLRDLKKVTIEIGFEGENNRTQVRIDCGEVFAEYPNAEAALKVQAPKGGIYPATVTRDGNMILWTVRDCDVANKGNGEFQLTFTDGETVVKTCPGKIHIDRSLKGSGTAPSGVQDWLDRAEDALEQVESAEIHQPMIGLDGYWYKWDQEEQQYVSTGEKARGEDGDPGQPGTDATPDLITVPYEDLTFPVAAGTKCYHDGKLYEANQAIQTSEQWTAAHWTETTVEEQLNTVKSALTFVKGDGDNSAVLDGEYYGISNSAGGRFSVAHGIGSKANGVYSHAEGVETIAASDGSHSEGSLTCAYRTYSHAEGSRTLSYGDASHAEGSGIGKDFTLTGVENATTYNVTSENLKEEDINAIIIYQNRVSKITSVDTANNTITIAHTFGNALSNEKCVVFTGYAYGNLSHTEGYGTISKGFASHAEGIFNTDDEQLPTWVQNTSYSVGDRVVRNGGGYICIEANTDATWTASKWKYAGIDTINLLMIGNGYDNIHRSNAFAVDVYGNGRFNGDVYAGCNEDSTGGTKVALVTDINPVVNVSGSTPIITAVAGTRYICGEVSTLTIVVPASGCIDVTFESGSTATVLTITPPSGKTIKWANSFDPTSLEANTIYELNILDGELGVACAWT